MSSSPPLTIIESHGIRALLAAVIAVFGIIRSFGRGLRNLACTLQPIAKPTDGPSIWARLWSGEGATARQVPVLWFDTRGGREGPIVRGLRARPRAGVPNR